MTVRFDAEGLHKRARRAYELGRLRAAVVTALVLSGIGAVTSSWVIGPRSAWFAPVTFLIWLGVSFRGGAMLRSARYGLIAGALTLVLPLSVLRPCCRWDAAGMGHCTMPEMCLVMGALVGLPLSVWVLSRGSERRFEAALGLWLGVMSFAAFKCSALFAGEALGLLAGIGLGVLVAGALGAKQGTSEMHV